MKRKESADCRRHVGTLAQTGVVTRHTEMPRVTSLFTASTFGQKRGPASCVVLLSLLGRKRPKVSRQGSSVARITNHNTGANVSIVRTDNTYTFKSMNSSSNTRGNFHVENDRSPGVRLRCCMASRHGPQGPRWGSWVEVERSWHHAGRCVRVCVQWDCECVCVCVCVLLPRLGG